LAATRATLLQAGLCRCLDHSPAPRHNTVVCYCLSIITLKLYTCNNNATW